MTTWTEARGRAGKRRRLRAEPAIPVLGFGSDNRSEFINDGFAFSDYVRPKRTSKPSTLKLSRLSLLLRGKFCTTCSTRFVSMFRSKLYPVMVGRCRIVTDSSKASVFFPGLLNQNAARPYTRPSGNSDSAEYGKAKKTLEGHRGRTSGGIARKSGYTGKPIRTPAWNWARLPLPLCRG